MLTGVNWFIAAHSMKKLMTKDHFLDLRDVHLMVFLLSHLLIAGCDIRVQISVRLSVCSSVCPSVNIYVEVSLHQ